MPPRFYLLHGPDEYGSAEFLAGIKDKMGDPAMAALNTNVFAGRSAWLPDVRAICDTMPFLTRRRLVIVEGWLTYLASKKAASQKSDESNTEDEETADEAQDGDAPEDSSEPTQPARSSREVLKSLIEYLPQVPETTALVFIEPRAIPDSNAVRKAAANAEWAYVKSFDLKQGPALLRWINNRAQAAGGTFTREAALALAAAESDPRALDSEILKLLTYVGFERPVEIEDIQALTVAGTETSIFTLVDAIGQRRGPLAQRVLHQILQTATPYQVMPMIIRQYRLLLQAKELLAANATDASVAKSLHINPYVAEKACGQARGHSMADLEHVYRRLLDYETDVKTGQMEPVTALNTFVAALTAG